MALIACQIRFLTQGRVNPEWSVSTVALCSAQVTVFVCANLDSAYFVLLDHFLTCGWAAPPVPPPHEYFPAIAAMHPGPFPP